MKILHYQRHADSGIHIHAYSSAACFFVPDEQVVFFADQRGTFGGVSYSITDREEMLEEANLLLQGESPSSKEIKYSDIKELEFEDEMILSLVKDAKRGKELEEKVKAGIAELIKEAKRDEKAERRKVAPIDPESLDDAARERLTQIVEEHVERDYFKTTFYRQLGDEQADEKEEQSYKLKNEEELRRSLRQIRNGKLRCASRDLFDYIEMAERDGLDDLVGEFAKLVYHDRRADSSQKLKAAEILGKPGKEVIKLKEERLLDTMTAHWDADDDEYFDLIRKDSEDIPEENIRKIALKAYKSKMKSKWGSGWFGKDILQAAKLAKTYQLGEKVFVAAGRKLVKINSKEQMPANIYELTGKAIAELEFPDEMVRPFMLEVFAVTVGWNSDQAREIEQKYVFSDKEMRGSVNEVHFGKIKMGAFEKVLELREAYGHLIDDKKISTEDIRTLAGVMNYKREESI